MPIYRLNIYDQNAQPRTDIPDSEIAKLDKQIQLPVFLDVMKTWPDTVEADAALVVAEKAKRAAISDIARREEAHTKIISARTFYDEWKRTVAGYAEPEIDPEVAKRAEKSTKGIEAAKARLEECERDIVTAKRDREAKRLKFAAAIAAWARVDGSPKNVGDLIKERAATEARQKMANIAAGLPANHVEAMASTVGPSHLDRFKAGQGKGGSANYGYHSNHLRGAQLPSQK